MSPPDAQADLVGRFAHVLIVEDNDVMRRSLARTVSRWGSQVRTADTLRKAAVEVALPLDLVIADVRLPDGSSYVLFEQATRLKPTPLLVAISGKASAAEAFQLAQIGVRGFLEKPFTHTDLRHCLCDALGQPEIERTMATSTFGAAVRRVTPELERFAQRHALTGQQTQIIRLSLSGVSRADLPAALGISENTCKSAVRRLLARCEAERLVEIVQRLLAQARGPRE